MNWSSITVQGLLKTENLEKIVITIGCALIVAIIVWGAKRFVTLSRGLGLKLLILARCARTPQTIRLEEYRKKLDIETFRVQHPWMKESQTLDNILVPVVTQSLERTQIEDWTVALARLIQHPTDAKTAQGARVALIGGPGAGKTVALRVAAREAWKLFPPHSEGHLIPILITFKEYREAGFSLLKAATSSLYTRGFSLDRDSYAAVENEITSEDSQKFVQGLLASGRMLVLIDALDELELKDRTKASERLCSELHFYPRAPAIITCRKAAWHGTIGVLRPELLEMADFTPAAIQQFVRQWKFLPPKSAPELLHIIDSQPHVADLARSPLMLTIISFLYSQPKYHLPENRAEFYEVCARALLQEWDQHRNPERANRFDKFHKEAVLAELAYQHLCGPQPDADLDERGALNIAGEVMQRHSLNASESGNMLQEIEENSGLLIRLPPSGLRFPHQTFMEFFAALGIVQKGHIEFLFANYERDSARWTRALALPPERHRSASTPGLDSRGTVAPLPPAGPPLRLPSSASLRLDSSGLAPKT